MLAQVLILAFLSIALLFWGDHVVKQQKALTNYKAACLPRATFSEVVYVDIQAGNEQCFVGNLWEGETIDTYIRKG